jgi:ABC-type lipoprotein export system ATPase subunit
MSMDPLLSLRGVSKSYWRGLREVKVLQDVSLDIHAGELVAVWGQRRSGKTTLLKLASGLEDPDAGAVLMSGQDLKTLTHAQFAQVLRGHVGWAKPTGPPENSGMLIRDYVAMPLLSSRSHRDAQRLAARALEKVGVPECAEQQWGSIADSEQALVAVAHALVREPRVLLVDDQTTSLDDLQREEVMELLRSLAEQHDMGVLVTVPDMAEMMHAHRIRSLSSGVLVAPADPSPGEGGELIDFPGVAAKREGAGGVSA